MHRVSQQAPRSSSSTTGLLLPPPERTLQRIIEIQTRQRGASPFLTVGDLSLTFAEVREEAARVGGLFTTAGLVSGDRLAIMSDDRMEILRCLLGCIWTGVVFVPINTASRGAQLEHILMNTAPKAAIIDPALATHLTRLRRPEELTWIWHIGEAHTRSWQGLVSERLPLASESVPATPVAPGDPLAILFTSGTTGPSKGVICPHAQFYWWAVTVGSMLGMRDDDTAFTCLPLFHTNALNAFAQALLHGARFVVGPRFSASQFWRWATAADATITYLLGTMVSILMATQPTAADRAHGVRVVLAPGTAPNIWDAFCSRFGVDIVEAYGMTETNGVIGPRDGLQRRGWMGRVMPGYDARVVDDSDAPVPDGVAGELVMRAEEPYAFSSGYWRMPEATVEAWRNLWFHSGDRAVQEDGWFRFVDRMKDAIRRRGENISAWEVEQVLIQHESVGSVAVIPVPSDLGEDEVMACVVAADGGSPDPTELVRFCEQRMPYFSVPRYVDILEALPLTENGKVKKSVLRERGVTSTTWDRVALGIEVKR